MQRDRCLLCTFAGEAFRDTPGVGESDRWSLPVLSLLPVLLHGIRANVLLHPPAGSASLHHHSDAQLVFDPSRLLTMMWAAVAELGVEARPPFAARFTDDASAFLNRWSLAQASLLRHVRDVGTTTVGRSLLGADVADKELCDAVWREIRPSLPFATVEERAPRNTGVLSGMVNVHVRSWRTPIIDVRPMWCLAATWTIPYLGGALVAPQSSPFLAASTSCTRRAVRSYADLAKMAYLSQAGKKLGPGTAVEAGPASGVQTFATKPGGMPSGGTMHSEHDQDSCICFLEQVSVFPEQLFAHPLLSLGPAKKEPYAEAAALTDAAAARSWRSGLAISLCAAQCLFFPPLGCWGCSPVEAE